MSYFAEINSINRDEALRYLAAGGSLPDEGLTRLMDECEKKLLAAVRGRFVFKVFDIESISEKRVTLKGTELVLSGDDICGHLLSCKKAVLLAATVGNDVDRLIRSEQVRDMAAAFVLDAMAGCAVEAVCEQAEEKIREIFPNLTWRFSPGYGDMPIECQKKFVEVLNAEREIGLTVNDSFIMIPRKSVTAVIGISDNVIEKKRSSCSSCSMKNSCIYRKNGSRCKN